MKYIISILIIGLNFVLLKGDQQSDSLASCTSRLNCVECIKTSGCAWCSQGDFHGADKLPFARCNTSEGHRELGRFKCHTELLYDPENTINVTKDERISIDGSTVIMPIKPQEATLKLRRGVPADINLEYGDPEDYPLDLYYLMDLTWTMMDDRDTLASLGDQLRKRMQDLTKKFSQGFGSFIDKVAMPFVMMSPQMLDNPCDGHKGCTKAYGFKHHLSISNSSGEFSNAVKTAKLSASIDKPEGGLDALMQAMVCTNEIGWSENARKLIIFATDAPFHIAGDGKLGGVIRPNDGKCHMDERGDYTHSVELDYPSIAQINQKAIQNSVNVIFAITDDQLGIYAELSKRIEGAKSAELSKNSSNIVDLVAEEYKKITSKVEISDTFPKQYVRVKYFSKCLEQTEEKETDTCDELPIGSIVKFTARFELLDCPANKEEWNQTYEIRRVGLNHALKINLQMLCDCPCENEENWTKKSGKCNGHGTEKCGLCECDTNFFGRTCECDATGGTVPEDEIRACKPHNSTDVEVCSGRGECYCGQCNCDKRPNLQEKYSGQYCECDNFSCDRANGQLCAGHGSCDCGTCNCNPGWLGSACDCSDDDNTCIQPGSDEICSGQGKCQCGKCTSCEGKYSGLYCEKCRHESCPTLCSGLTPCVQCKINGDASPNCKDKCSDFSLTPVDVITQDSESEETYCKAEDSDDDCSFYFVYTQQPDRSVEVTYQKNKECPPELPIFWILLGIASVIVVIGLIVFIIWKVYTVVLDRREYATFENERKKANFQTGHNPLYQTPVGTYQNPTYGKPIN